MGDGKMVGARNWLLILDCFINLLVLRSAGRPKPGMPNSLEHSVNHGSPDDDDDDVDDGNCDSNDYADDDEQEDSLIISSYHPVSLV